MKRLMATLMVVGMTVTGFTGVAMAAEPTEAAQAVWSEGTQAKIEQARINREENQALAETIRTQHATIKELMGSKKQGIGQDVRETLARRKAALEEKRAASQTLRAQAAEVQQALREALAARDRETAAALKADLQALQDTAQTERAEWQAEADELKALTDELRGAREAVQAKWGQVKQLLDEARVLQQEHQALRAEFEPVKEAIQAAREAQDDAAMSAALDDLLALQSRRHEILVQMTEVLDQIIDVLQ